MGDDWEVVGGKPDDRPDDSWRKVRGEVCGVYTPPMTSDHPPGRTTELESSRWWVPYGLALMAVTANVWGGARRHMTNHSPVYSAIERSTVRSREEPDRESLPATHHQSALHIECHETKRERGSRMTEPLYDHSHRPEPHAPATQLPSTCRQARRPRWTWNEKS